MKPLIKYVVIPLVALAVILGGGYGGYKGYKSFQQKRLIKQARAFMEKSPPTNDDKKKAMLCLQRAIRFNSKNVEACRLMAQLLEQVRSPASLIWRNRVVELNPKSTEDRLILAQSAISGRDYVTATNALNGVTPEGKKTAIYHNVAGTVCVAGGEYDTAETHYLEANRLDPQNASYQVNLSVLRLQRTNEQAIAEARNTLKILSVNTTNGPLRCQALRELMADAARHKLFDSALVLVDSLLRETNSTFSDRLLRLELLGASTNSEFSSALADAQRDASTEPTKVYELGSWQLPRLGATNTLNWLRTLAPNMQTTQPGIMILIADCLDLTGDWPRLQTTLQQQNWGELDFVRHALLARAFRGQKLEDSAKTEWQLAHKAAATQLATLKMLLGIVSQPQWNWETEGEDVLTSIINRYPREKWAFDTLAKVYVLSGKTRPLMMLCNQEVKRSPDWLDVKNNLAAAALLLEAYELKPHDLAREVFEKAPTNAAYASTYALSLYRQEKYPEALKVFQGFKPKDLENPAIAGYYGLMLKANGEAERAKGYIEIATTNKAPLLPEERKIFAEKPPEPKKTQQKG